MTGFDGPKWVHKVCEVREVSLDNTSYMTFFICLLCDFNMLNKICIKGLCRPCCPSTENSSANASKILFISK